MCRVPLLMLIVLSVAVRVMAESVSQATFLFLTIPPSPQLNGIGGALTLSGMKDPLAAMINPAALGMAAQTQRVGAAFYPSRTSWLPQYHLSGLTYSTRALMAGASLQQWLPNSTLPVYAGIGYEEVYLNLGETQRRGPENEILGTFGSWERARGLTVAASVSRPVVLSVGWTFKRGESDLGFGGNDTTAASASAHATMSDFGIVVAVPALELVLQRWSIPGMERHLRPHFTPMYGYSVTNIGGDVTYAGHAQADPLPRTVHATIGISAGLTMRDRGGDWQIVDLEWATQGEDELVWRDPWGHHKYRRSLGDVNVVNDLLLGGSNERIDKRYGWEMGVLDLLAVSSGRVELRVQDWSYDTNGFTLRLGGMLRLLSRLSDANPPGRTLPFLMEHVDLQYSESHWNVRGGFSPSDDTHFRELSLYLR